MDHGKAAAARERACSSSLARLASTRAEGVHGACVGCIYDRGREEPRHISLDSHVCVASQRSRSRPVRIGGGRFLWMLRFARHAVRW